LPAEREPFKIEVIMTEPEPVDPAVQKWRARYMRVKVISILSMIGCMSYMLLWSSSRTDVAFIWLGLTMLFSFGGAQFCQWQIRRLDEEEEEE
jgi:hypothetical protein